MRSLGLWKYPLTLESTFASSTILTYAFEVDRLQAMLPPHLSVDASHGSGYLAVAFVDSRDVRLRGWSRRVSRDVFLIEYLIFVCYRTSDQRVLRGLYLLASETDSRVASLIAGLVSPYRLDRTDLVVSSAHRRRTFVSDRSSINVSIDLDDPHGVPSGSPFSSWEDAQAYVRPRSFIFVFHKPTNSMLIMRGILKNWNPHPVRVTVDSIGFVESFSGAQGRLALAQRVEDVPYLFKKSRVDACTS